MDKKKKILVIIDHLGVGGVQEFILNYAKNIKEHSIHVVSLFGSDIYSSRLLENGASVEFLSEKEYNYFNILNPWLIIKFFKRIKVGEYDYAHLTLFVSFFYGSIFRFYRHKNVFPSLHCTTKQIPGIIYWMYRIWANKYEQFLLNNSLWAEYPFINRDKLFNLEYFITERVSIANNPMKHALNFLSIGRFIEQKGFIDSIKLFNEINKKYKQDMGLYIIGDGSHRKIASDFLANNNINNVYLLGTIENLDDYMCNATMIFKMSFNESHNSVVRESLYIGIPVASTIENAECEKVLQADLYIRLDRENLKESAKRVIQYLENPVPKKDIIRKARKFWENSNNLKLYEEHRSRTKDE